METKPNDSINNTFYSLDDGQVKIAKTERDGLTKREYFAAKAMQGIASDHTFIRPNEPEQTAKLAVDMADALIKALNTPQ